MKKKKMLALLLALTLLMGMVVTSCSSSSSKKDTSKKHSSKSADDEYDDDEDDDEDEKDVKEKDNDKDNKKDIDDKVEMSNTPEDAMKEYMQYVLIGDYAKAASLTHEKIYNIDTLFTHLDDKQSEIAKLLINTSTFTVSDFGYDENEASCYLNLTYKDYETFYDRYRDDHIKWTFEDFMNELNKVDYTTTEEINFELIQEGKEWVIISDTEFWDFLYDMLEPFEVPDVYEYIPKEFSELLSKSFESENLIPMLKDSEMRYSIYPMLNFEEGQDQFIEEYVKYISYEWNLVSIDKDSEIAVFTVSALIPDTKELDDTVLNDSEFLRRFNVVSYAYAYADKKYFDEGQIILDNMKIDAAFAALDNCSKKTKTIELTMTFEEIDNSKIPEELCDCLFFEVTKYEYPKHYDVDLFLIKLDAIDYALNNGLIDQARWEALNLQILNDANPTEEVEAAESTPPTEETNTAEILRVENRVFYADTSVLGMSYDEANQFYGNVFSTPEVWEWGTYDSYLDFYYDDNMYTAFFANNTLMAIRREFIASDIPEEILSAYNELYGSSSILSDEYGNNTMRGEQGSGYRFFTDFGHIDVFMNIYDDLAHVAIHYTL